MHQTFIILSCLCLISACQPIKRVLFGIQSIDTVDHDKIKAFYADIIPATVDFEVLKLKMDSSQFETYRRLGLTDQDKKDLSQPVQMLYFKQDSIVAFYANCYAKGGFGKLKWNHAGDFDSFPIHSARTTINGAYPSLPNIQDIMQQQAIGGKPYAVCFIWTRSLEKVAKSGLEEVIQNIQAFQNADQVQLILLNTDDFYMNQF